MNAHTAHAPIIGTRLFRLAVQWAASADLPGTQKDREEAIRSVRRRKAIINGSKSIRAAREATEAAAQAIRTARFARIKSRYRRNAGTPASHRIALARADISKRLVRHKVAKFQRALDGYRVDQAPAITLTTDPSAVGVRQSESLDWDYYAKSCKYPKKVVDTTITIPAAWGTRVAARGLAVVGGLATLDAQPIEGTPEDVALYAATWIEQGRGYELRAIHGYLAAGEGENYHGSTPEQAMTGLRRKLGLKKADAALTDLLAKHGLDGVAARCPDLTVTVQDARASGSCEYGIRSWCNRTGLDYDAGSAPLAEVYLAYRQQPQSEARAAILHALRRSRKAVLRAAA